MNREPPNLPTRIACWMAGCLALAASFGVDARTRLDYGTLVAGSYRNSIDLSAYAPGADARMPTNRFEGRLRLHGQPRTRTLIALPDYLDPGDTALARSLPEDFDYAFIQDGRILVPVVRGPIAGSHPWWEFVLEPGQVWDEPGDHGYSRAAIPFALVQKNANCTHNGVLMFLFKSDGAVSRAAMQISSETCHYLQLDMWGLLEADYEPGAIGDRDAILAAQASETARRLPVRPLSALARDHPGLDPAGFAIGAPQGRTAYGLVLDGIHYRSTCATRHGDHPYCEVLDLPSYSVAKSVVAGIALMRMEALHPGTRRLPVSDWVSATGCRTGKWADVRLQHLLDMTTGQYDSPAYMADEDDPRIRAFFGATDHATRVAYACEAYAGHEAPGTRWVYHTPDTYLLGTALQQVLRRRTGRADADIFEHLVWSDVFAPLGLSATARATRRSHDAARQPFSGWGLTLHADDIAKLGQFLANANGRIGDHQVLDPILLGEALQRDPAHPGLQVAQLERYRYQHGFWARNLQSELGCGSATWIPFMSGFGGITVALFPEGSVWYNVADDGLLASIDFARPARELAKRGSLCTESPAP